MAQPALSPASGARSSYPNARLETQSASPAASHLCFRLWLRKTSQANGSLMSAEPVFRDYSVLSQVTKPIPKEWHKRVQIDAAVLLVLLSFLLPPTPTTHRLLPFPGSKCIFS